MSLDYKAKVLMTDDMENDLNINRMKHGELVIEA